MMNRLILGDNLEILKTLESESVDLVYLDPPFFSNRNYEVIWGDEAETRSFIDRWAGGIGHYIAWLKERVEGMHRVLKPTGSLFLHCDWHADAYIRVDILDKLFGSNNFRNHIIWKRTNAKNNITQRFGTTTDSIFFYSKTNEFAFTLVRGAYSKEQLERYKQEDEKGMYRCENLTTPGKSRQFIWRGVHPGENRSWCLGEEKLEELYAGGLILLQKDGRPRKDGLKKYLAEADGALFGNLWDDIDRVGNTSKERIGYPTQKPEALLERIIQCASKAGDVVLDPFVGGGTTVAVAERLGRQWIGIDQSPVAVRVTERRLERQQELFSSDYTVTLHKYDYDTLRNQDAFAFESFIVTQFGGVPNAKQRGDLGIDGKTAGGTPIQVKRSEVVGRNVIDNFIAALQRFDKTLLEKNIAEKKPIGYLIAFSFGKGAIEETARLKNKEDRIIELVTVEQIVPLAVKPSLIVHVREVARDEAGIRELEFFAVGQGDAPVEFYSWDFAYDSEHGFRPTVLLDKSGTQTAKFAAGEHTIAVKVVDSEGLENTELVTLKLNGDVQRMERAA